MIVGLTGSIATGKSTLMAAASSHLNWQGWSADAAVAWLYQFDEAFIKEIAQLFPEVHHHSVINKELLVQVVLSVPEAMNELERVLYPRLKKLLEGVLERMQGQNIILEIPLLFECGWENFCNQTIVLVCNESVQKQRLLRKNYPQDLQDFLLKRHWNNGKKSSRADYIIDTSGYIGDVIRDFFHQLNGILERPS